MDQMNQMVQPHPFRLMVLMAQMVLMVRILLSLLLGLMVLMVQKVLLDLTRPANLGTKEYTLCVLNNTTTNNNKNIYSISNVLVKYSSYFRCS
jgi:hypothetical protein